MTPTDFKKGILKYEYELNGTSYTTLDQYLQDDDSGFNEAMEEELGISPEFKWDDVLPKYFKNYTPAFDYEQSSENFEVELITEGPAKIVVLYKNTSGDWQEPTDFYFTITNDKFGTSLAFIDDYRNFENYIDEIKSIMALNKQYANTISADDLNNILNKYILPFMTVEVNEIYRNTQLINNGKANLTLNNISGNLVDIDDFKNDLPSKIQDRILNKFNKHMTVNNSQEI